MAAGNALTASPATLAEVFSNGKRYIVPPFQRDYAWGEPEWAELWEDIIAASSPATESSHFLGALVLQPTSERDTFNIIDGQQRLVTLSVMVLAAISLIEGLDVDEREKQNNDERARLLRERFVSTKDSSSLQHRSRMKLNQTDDGFYQTYILQGKVPKNHRSGTGSEKRLQDCFDFFASKIRAHLGDAVDGAAIARFLDDRVANRLRFIEIRVEDDETAFTVFETLNARGVALGTADLLKNYIYACASKGGASDLEIARQHWARILRFIELEKVATLLFHKLAGSVQDLREKRVFVELKRIVPQKATVFDFLSGLESAAEVYTALDDPEADLWSAEMSGARESVRVLCTLGLDQYKSVALAAFERFRERPEKFERVLRNLVIISVRATVAKINTGDLARAYHSTAFSIERGDLKSPQSITRALASVTPSDEDFRRGFETLTIDPKGRRKRFLRYLFSKLEEDMGSHPIDFDAADATIEHVLPENPNQSWPNFSAEDRARDTSRLGNLTPLESALNKTLGGAPYDEKRRIYQQSTYAMTRTIDATEWSPASIRLRQAALALLAVQRWRIGEDVD